VARTAKTAKSISALVLPAAILIWFGFTVSAKADSPRVSNASSKQLLIWARECLEEASDSDDAAYQKKVLGWAFDHLIVVLGRNKPYAQLDLAIADVRAALDDLKKQADSDTIRQDIKQALQDVGPLAPEPRLILR
jgi:hypothetical protein